MDKIFLETQKRMEKAMEVLRAELSTLRTGRASLSILDGVRVDYYGTPTPLNQLATLSIPDPRTIAIAPWDTSVSQAIERAIQTSDLGLSAVGDGRIIRISLPALNEERRKELVKVLKRYAEESKVSIRNARRDANEEVKKLKKDGTLSEDDERKSFDRIQKLTDDFIKKIDDSSAHKEKDIMEV